MTTLAATDEAELHEYINTVIGYMNGAASCLGIWLGDELGLYSALADIGPVSSDGLAHRTGCQPRLVREWLDGQAAAGLVSYEPTSDVYHLRPGAATVLADDSSSVFVARGMKAFGAMFVDLDRLADAFRGDGAFAWGDHDPHLFDGTEWFFRTGYRAYLTTAWLPALHDAGERLKVGARVADIGCGHGASTVVMARAYPLSQFWGFDSHQQSIQAARSRAAEGGVTARTTFEVATAKSYPGTYDLICFFDCLHDMGDPLGAARYAREHMTTDGSVMLVEPYALDDHGANITGNPLAPLLYMASSAVCTPNSLSQEVGLALGAQAGEAQLRELFAQAGFSQFRRVAETPLNLILEARP